MMHRKKWFAISLTIALQATIITCSIGRADDIRLEPTRDTWLSAVGDEARGGNGGASRLKFKSIQELSLIDFDFPSLRGKQIVRGSLFLKQASDVPLERMTISTLGADWIEGTGTNYQIADRQSTFSHRDYPKQRWSDSDITAVSLGAGSTLWRSIEPVRMSDGWYRYDVPSELIEPCVAGLSPGWLLMDDTGSTWKRDGEKFEYQLFPNRFAFSKDSNRASMPYVVIEVSSTARTKVEPVPQPLNFHWSPPESQSADPRARLQWTTTAVESSSLIVGFRLKADDQKIEQYLMPAMTNNEAESYTMILDPQLPPWDLTQPKRLELRAIGRDGRESEPAFLDMPALNMPVPKLPWSDDTISPSSSPKQTKLDWKPCLKFNDMRIAVIDPLDHILPDQDEIVPPNRSDYLTKNLFWNSDRQTISVQCCRGAWCGFQLAIQKPQSNVELSLELSGISGLRTDLYRYEYVAGEKGLVADPLVPVSESQVSLKNIRIEPSAKTQAAGCWLVELYVPQETNAGSYKGVLRLKSDRATVDLNLTLEVKDIVIPKELSFLPEMNCYDLPSNDVDYYRLGHRHRVVLNRVPYFQNGKLAEGLAPRGMPGDWDWSEWDRRFGGLFSGEAFADLPRGATPIECFYFPLHENWPVSMEGSYNGSYWAEEAFPESYRRTWQQTAREFISHVENHQWHATRFHVFLNNKVDFKKRGWSRGSSPWLLDEPANFQDFAALQFYGRAFQSAYAGSSKATKVIFRCDISRPQWQRDTLDGLMRYNVVSQSAFREYHRLVIDRKLRNDQTVVIYGSSNPIGTNNFQSVAWAWDTWCRGGDGILPWQTIGNEQSWIKPDELALFYPNPKGGGLPPLPSIRLKAYCYAQQDVEALRLLYRDSASQEMDRYTWGKSVTSRLPFRSESRKDANINEDAGWVDYGNMTPETMEAYRRAIPTKVSN